PRIVGTARGRRQSRSERDGECWSAEERLADEPSERGARGDAGDVPGEIGARCGSTSRQVVQLLGDPRGEAEPDAERGGRRRIADGGGETDRRGAADRRAGGEVELLVARGELNRRGVGEPGGEEGGDENEVPHAPL